MLPFLLFIISFAQAGWGPYPMDEVKYEGAIRQKLHPPCSFHQLIDGQALPQNKALYRIRKPKNAFGTPRLIQTLINATEEVSLLQPKTEPLVVGDLSTRYGGKLKGHKSHQGGSDADVGLYWKKGSKIANDLMAISPRQFDAKTNGIFVRSLLDSGEIERILLDQALVDILRRYAVRKGELTAYEANYIFPAEMKPHIWRRYGVVHHHPGHHHHYHIRAYCEKSKLNN